MLSSVTSATSRTSRPGAYEVTRTSSGPTQAYRVSVPEGVLPGNPFYVDIGTRRVRVQCPSTSRPGHLLKITMPPESVTHTKPLKSAPLTAATGDGGGGAEPISPDVHLINVQARELGGSAQTDLVTIPPSVFPGMEFTANVDGQCYTVRCPPNARPDMRVRIVLPVQREEPEAAPQTQMFEVAVPPGVQPGQTFSVVAAGDQPVSIQCPPNVVAGQKIRFQLPVSQVAGNIQLAYESEKEGWRRTIRVADLKFQWVRLDVANGADRVDNHFDFMKFAYIRKIEFLEGNDVRMRTGIVELVPASDAVVDSQLVYKNRTLSSYADIAQTQRKPLEEKQGWFENICNQLTQPWEEGHIEISIHRSHLLLDSVDAVMALSRQDLRKQWRFEFLGEPGRDASGLTREWFELVTDQLFDPAFGLWLPSINNQACVDISPTSELACPDDHLIIFRFTGRVIGRALFDRQIIKGHMVRLIYKHLLGWPITFEDVKAHDEEYYHSQKKVAEMDDLSFVYLDFTVTEDLMGNRVEKELIEGGSEKSVTKENLAEYLEASIKYRLFTRTLPQLTELLLGFFDVIPEPALTVFDANELELILCGLPEINMEDWQMNTTYTGLFETKGRTHQVVRWFWEVITEEFDREMRARLLQFCTGTSGVPLRGFAYLQGIDGIIKKFTVQGIDYSLSFYPKSHTCFNRIDLPLYTTKDELHDKLKLAVTTSYIGFGID